MADRDLRRRRRSLVGLLAALGCVGLLLLLGAGPQARAARRLVSRASAPSCPSNGSGVISLYGVGAKPLSETNLPLCATGRLTVTFTGGTGGTGDTGDTGGTGGRSACAVGGLCGYAGTESWQPQNPGDLVISDFEQHGRRHASATMFVGGPGSTVRSAVQRSQANGTTTACSDQGQVAAGFFALPVRGARVTIGLGHADEPLLGTRCAGPLDADLAAALPSRTLGLSRIARGRTTVDLTGSRRFSARGLAGTVRSTIVLVLGRPRRSAGSGEAAPPPGVERSRLATVTYRVARIGGHAITTVRSSPIAAVCGPFDACGLQGVIQIAPGAGTGGSVYLTATAALRRPRRDLLAALGSAGGGNRAGIGVQGAGEASLRGELTAELTQGSACKDQVRLRRLGIDLRQRAGRLEVSVSPALAQAADPLRTRCPGPELGSHQLTSASVPLSVLRHPSFTVALHGGSFSDGPYRATTRSTLTVTLARARAGVRMQIVPFLARSG